VAGTSRARRARAPLIFLAAAALLAAGCGSSSNAATSSHHTRSTASGHPARGPERVPLESGAALAPAATAPGFTVDGIQCAPVEQLAYHIHAHLQVYVNGQPRSLPGAIGLLGPVLQQTPVGRWYTASKCYYWLHTHTSDGIIHIESPTARIYTLGDFFDEWGQPLSPRQVAEARGTVTAFINGKAWTKNPRAIPLRPHGVIQLDVGSPAVPFVPMSWAGVQL
jgi:hypothetical protein